MLQVLDALAVRRWCAAGLDALTAARVEIDDLNVFPVPDGDTGTNLQLTMESVAEAVDAAPAGMSATVGAMAHGALMGARGNSGVILSQLLRGLAEVLAEDETASSEGLQRALIRAAELAYGAVAAPVEGTVLTVAREAAASAAELGPADLAAVVKAAAAGATAALARTTEQLPALRAAGVVDAGGRGLCVLLDALEQVVTGVARVAAVPVLLVPRDRRALVAAREDGSAEFGYEVQYLLRDAEDDAVEVLKAVLADLGDSLVVVGGDALHNVHVHVNDVGAAIEAGVEAGTPFRITVTRFADQVAADKPAAGTSATGRGVVAVTAGPGLGALFEQAGAVVVDGGPTANPSTAELLDAIRRSGAAEVVLLPNDANTIGVAGAAASAARDEGYGVAVVPTRSTVQGLAALAVSDESRPFADDVAAMADAAGSTRWAEVTVAVRESMTMAGVCRPGDVLGLIEGDVVLIGADVEEVARELVDRMLAGGGELVTVVSGQDAPDGLVERLSTYVEKSHPAAEAVGYDGGQPHYPVLLGVE
ncbi:MAG: DAK2 domain-containing protein [Frankiaceae bacterium]|nr:DAK2 domain-containing protein [Frankiaceae bacterium]